VIRKYAGRTKTGSRKAEPLMAVTMGDPAGIGPEIVALALENEMLRKGSLVARRAVPSNTEL
jgi:4-hydroxy-L-threonine phosphate dehydrogenase PdxA